MNEEPRAVSEGSHAERVGMVRELAQRGDVSQLIELLTEPSWFVRRKVVTALAGLGEAAAGHLLHCLTTRRDDETRIAATVDALVSSSAASLEATLVALVDAAPPPAVLADLAQILGRRRSRGAYETLGRLTAHVDDNVAVGAIEALGRLGGRAAVDALLECLKARHFFRSFPAIDVLGRSGDPRVVEPLSELLDDSRYTLEAARALGRTADRRAIKPLAALLTSPSDSNVRVACLALLELCERHAQQYGAVAMLRDALRRAGSESIVRRLGQVVARADRAEKAAICSLLGALQRESATPILLSLLDAEPEVTEAAGKALVEVGRPSEHALYDALVSGSSKRRKALLPVFTQRSSGPAIIACLDDGSADVRALACATLARLGAVDGVPRLFALLADESQRVVHAAVAAIQSLGTQQTEALALAAAREPRTRRAALRVLAYFGFASALPLFREAVRETDPRLRELALQGLALIDQPEAREILLEVAQAEDPAIRAATVRALGRLSDEPASIQMLMKSAHDPDAWVRYYACQALARRKAEGVEEVLRGLVQDPAGQVRVAAIEGLSHTGSPRAIETVREFADHEDLDMRRAALVGLGLTRDQRSLPALQDAAAHADAATRLVALSALAGFPDEQAIATLHAAARDPLEMVSVAAINLLASRPGQHAADVLVALLLESRERAQLVQALSTPLADRVAALQAALEGADDDQAALLMACIARSGAPSAQAALFHALASSNPAARKAAVGALVALGTPEALRAVAKAADMDPDLDVRRASQLHLMP